MTRFVRPPTPPGFDSSRAAERAADPQGWRYDGERLRAVYDVMAERRDVRRFRPDELGEDVLERILTAAHQAPSVGLMQPWRFIIVRSLETRAAIRALAQQERLRQADRFDQRARHFLDQKIEGVVEAPLGICVCCDHGDPDTEVLGRGTIPQTDIYSTACAIQNLWLAARAEGVGVGWVSFYKPAELGDLLGLPGAVEPLAYLCLGWPDERPVRPTLEAVGWGRRLPLSEVVMHEHWRSSNVHRPVPASTPTFDRRAAIAARDRLDEMVKPAGSLGALEPLIERWALITGSPPPERIRAGVLICAGDHGHVRHETSLFGSHVSAQVAASAAARNTAAGTLSRGGDHPLLIADVGLIGETPAGATNVKVAEGTADFTAGSAMTPEQLSQAIDAGRRLVPELLRSDIHCLALGEIGIGNTTTAAALGSALLNVPPALTVGRGTGLDADGVERKLAVVASALELHGPEFTTEDALAKLGGFEFAALVGAMLAALELRLPVILDGFAVGVAAVAATRIEPLTRELTIASHRSAEPGHHLVLTELGLEPLLDLRLRLGEASGALLALPLIEAAGTLHRRMGTFDEAGIVQPR